MGGLGVIFKVKEHLGEGQLSGRDFIYDRKQDRYRCPQNHYLYPYEKLDHRLIKRYRLPADVAAFPNTLFLFARETSPSRPVCCIAAPIKMKSIGSSNAKGILLQTQIVRAARSEKRKACLAKP